jgi:uncharacterized protein
MWMVQIAYRYAKGKRTPMMDDQQRLKLEAAVLRRLLTHLQQRSDVQNIDLMAVGGFCRNCLSEWLEEAAHTEGLPMDQEAARAHIYGMSYADYKARYQTAATAAQLAAMEASLVLNKKARGEA